MSDTGEYAVRLTDYMLAEKPTTDPEEAWDCLRSMRAEKKAGNPILAGTEPTLVMRTCTPWCEVKEPKEIGEGNGQ